MCVCGEEHNPTYPGFGAGIVRGMQQLNRWSLLLPFPTAGHTQKKKQGLKGRSEEYQKGSTQVTPSGESLLSFLEATATACGDPGVIPPSAQVFGVIFDSSISTLKRRILSRRLCHEKLNLQRQYQYLRERHYLETWYSNVKISPLKTLRRLCCIGEIQNLTYLESCIQTKTFNEFWNQC